MKIGRERLCECGLHMRDHNPYPRLIELGAYTEVICVTQPGDEHTQYRAGRQWGEVTVRVPKMLLYPWFWLRWRLTGSIAG